MKKILIVTIIVISSLIFLNSPTQAAVCNQTTISSVSTEYSGTPAIIGNGDIVRVNGDSFGNQGSYCIHDSNNSKTMEVHFVSPDGSVDKNVTPVSMSSGCKVSGYNPITDFNSSMVLFKIDLSIFTDSELQKFVDGGSVQVWNPTYDNGIFGSSVLCGSSNFKLTRFSDLSCSYTYSNWSYCPANGIQTRTLLSTSPNDCPIGTPVLSQSCTFIPPICTSWIYSDWSDCSVEGSQTRTINSASPANCANGNPLLSQACVYVPKCTLNNWSCDNWSACSSDSTQNRACTKTANCKGGVSSPAISQTCAYTPPTCNYEYSSWSQCSTNGTQIRNAFPYPSGCSGGKSITSQSCAPSCTISSWQCDDWNTCTSNGKQTRVCKKLYNCEGGSQSPVTTQYCSYSPSCSEDIWQCSDWGICSPNGIQTRSCKRTYDCQSVETPAPATSQYCQATQTLPSQTSPQDNYQNSQDTDLIVRATVKLACYTDRYNLKGVGSGTIISQDGVILTNRHNVEGTIGCKVGFQDSIDDALPDYREIADVSKISVDQNLDIALLKIRKNQNYQWVDITKGNSHKFRAKERIYIYGYPVYLSKEIQKKMSYVDQEGQLLYSNMTATDGVYGGNYANIFIKTGGKIEHGNSGGGAYSESGLFIGMPTAGLKGELESLGLVLTSQKINQWINNSQIAINNLGSTISPVLQKVSLEKTKFLFLDVSNAEVNIFSDKSKKTLLPNSPETVQAFSKPVFQISNLDDSEIKGYYVYFGNNINADPTKNGKFIKKSEYAPSVIQKKNIYYFIFRAKDSNGNISDPVITEYRYKK